MGLSEPNALGSEAADSCPATSAPPLDCPVTLPPGLARLSTRPVATGSPAPAIATDLGVEDDCGWSFAEYDTLRNKLTWRATKKSNRVNSYALQLVLGR